MLRWRDCAPPLGVIMLSTLLTGPDGHSNFERNGGSFDPLLYPPLPLSCNSSVVVHAPHPVHLFEPRLVNKREPLNARSIPSPTHARRSHADERRAQRQTRHDYRSRQHDRLCRRLPSNYGVAAVVFQRSRARPPSTDGGTVLRSKKMPALANASG